MAEGETSLRTWALVGGGVAILISVFFLVLCVLSMVDIRGNPGVFFKDTVFNFSAAMIVFALTGVVLGGVSIAKVERAHRLYVSVKQNQSNTNITPANNNPLPFLSTMPVSFSAPMLFSPQQQTLAPTPIAPPPSVLPPRPAPPAFPPGFSQPPSYPPPLPPAPAMNVPTVGPQIFSAL